MRTEKQLDFINQFKNIIYIAKRAWEVMSKEDKGTLLFSDYVKVFFENENPDKEWYFTTLINKEESQDVVIDEYLEIFDDKNEDYIMEFEIGTGCKYDVNNLKKLRCSHDILQEVIGWFWKENKMMKNCQFNSKNYKRHLTSRYMIGQFLFKFFRRELIETKFGKYYDFLLKIVY